MRKACLPFRRPIQLGAFFFFLSFSSVATPLRNPQLSASPAAEPTLRKSIVLHRDARDGLKPANIVSQQAPRNDTPTQDRGPGSLKQIP